MDLTVDQFIEGLFAKEAHETPSDVVKVEDLELKLPDWFNRNKYKQGCRFFNDNMFAMMTSMVLGVIALLAIPSILKVLMATRRSSSGYTAYRRYAATALHIYVWFQGDLKPGTMQWKSLHDVRRRHLRTTLSGKLMGYGIVSQRDLALTLFGFVGFVFLKPDHLALRQLKKGDWEAYNHCWRTIGYMVGIEDRYNICRNTIEETREVCAVLQERVFTPCMTNVPEHFEYMGRVLLDGVSTFIPIIHVDAVMYYCKYLGDVPGYIYTESERIELQKKLALHLKGKPIGAGIEASDLISAPALYDAPPPTPNPLYIADYDNMETVPVYKHLSFYAKLRLHFNYLLVTIYSTYVGRVVSNFLYTWTLYFLQHFPYFAFLKYGIKQSFINIFEDGPTTQTEPKPNSHYYRYDPVTKRRQYL